MNIQHDRTGRGDEAPEQIVAAMVATPLRRTCSPLSTVTEAVLIFKDENCGMIPVVDQGKPLGMVTDRDVALAVVEVPELAEQPVSRIMNRDFTTISNEASVDEVVRSMVTSKAQSIFMVDANGRLDGLISWPDLTARIPLEDMIEVLEPAPAEHE
jgi:CBS domain-containing protein